METLEVLKKRIKSGEDLQSVVRTMKTLAAVNIRQYDGAVETLSHYNNTVEMGLRAVLKYASGKTLGRSAGGGTVSVIFGSDQGLCGRFNDIVADHYMASRPSRNNTGPPLYRIGVGDRLVGRLEEAHISVDEAFEVPGSLSAITPMTQALLLRLQKLMGVRTYDRLALTYNRIVTGVVYEPCTTELLPLDRNWLDRVSDTPWPTRGIPALRGEDETVFSRLVQQFLFVSLYRASAESIAAENASRLFSMQSAERNIGETLDAYRMALRLKRQSDITDELIDIVSGFEALTDQADRGT